MGSLTVLCSIGTTHPWNIAGVGLDARVAAHLGARHVAVIAGVSAQGSGEAASAPIPAQLVTAQLRAVRDTVPNAYRIGALVSSQTILALVGALADVSSPIVCDPVIATSDGLRLADEAQVDALRRLFARCSLVTPNLAEASALCGFPVNDRATMAGAAHMLVERDGAGAALIKGGHLDNEATDVLYARGTTTTFEGSRLAQGMRGTGCVLAVAAAIALGRGANVLDAVAAARALVRDAIEHAVPWSGERVWPW